MSAPVIAQGALPQGVAEDIQRYVSMRLPQAATVSLVIRSETDGLLSVRETQSEQEETLQAPIAFSQLAHFVSRIDSALCAPEPSITVAKGVLLNLKRQWLRSEQGQEVSLTSKEAALLDALLSATPQLATRAELLETVWRYDEHIDTRTLETHIYRLRQKLEPFGLSAWLQTMPEGYAWQEKP